MASWNVWAIFFGFQKGRSVRWKGADSSVACPLISPNVYLCPFNVQGPIYGSRTMLLGAIALVLLSLRNVRALAWMLAIGAFLPFFDMGLIISQTGPGPILLRHAAYIVWLGLAALLFWRLAPEAASPSREALS
ncbi:DUF4267 domain-containing protein [Phreatobacter aquaticus]|nr:DUF4267 domain-containing protein [Phreatobacter aquaticus]